MERRDVIVGYVSRLEYPDTKTEEALRAPIVVHFEHGRTAKLSPHDRRSKPYAALLENLHRDGIAVYAEIDPANDLVAMLHIPLRVTVTDLAREGSGDVDVTLRPSQARHFVHAKNPHFDALLAALENARERRATVLVTETDDHEIIDVQAAPERPPAHGRARELELERERERDDEREQRERGEEREERERDEEREIERGLDLDDDDEDERRPGRLARCVSPERAEALFDLCENTTCDPSTVPPPCIPFLYPDNGCWARAHEMCRLIRAAGVQPAKVWITGSLHVASRNKPDCLVLWGWHVAPTICVEDEDEDEAEQLMVIDPSLFDQPVTEATWKALQGDPQAGLVQTAWTQYYHNSAQTDPTFAMTQADLATYRAKLQLRSIQHGPPPYANCP